MSEILKALAEISNKSETQKVDRKTPAIKKRKIKREKYEIVEIKNFEHISLEELWFLIKILTGKSFRGNKLESLIILEYSISRILYSNNFDPEKIIRDIGNKPVSYYQIKKLIRKRIEYWKLTARSTNE